MCTVLLISFIRLTLPCRASFTKLYREKYPEATQGEFLEAWKRASRERQANAMWKVCVFGSRIAQLRLYVDNCVGVGNYNIACVHQNLKREES